MNNNIPEWLKVIKPPVTYESLSSLREVRQVNIDKQKWMFVSDRQVMVALPHIASPINLLPSDMSKIAKKYLAKNPKSLPLRSLITVPGEHFLKWVGADKLLPVNNGELTHQYAHTKGEEQAERIRTENRRAYGYIDDVLCNRRILAWPIFNLTDRIKKQFVTISVIQLSSLASHKLIRIFVEDDSFRLLLMPIEPGNGDLFSKATANAPKLKSEMYS